MVGATLALRGSGALLASDISLKMGETESKSTSPKKHATMVKKAVSETWIGRGGKRKKSASPEFSTRALYIFQIVQITSQRLCASEKEKSGAGFAFSIQQIAEMKNPSFFETCTFRFLVAYADPHVALPDFCRAESVTSRSKSQPNLQKSVKRKTWRSVDFCGRWRSGRKLNRQISKGQCRFLCSLKSRA